MAERTSVNGTPDCIGHLYPACDGIGSYDTDFGRAWLTCTDCLGTGNDPAYHDPRQSFVPCSDSGGAR